MREGWRSAYAGLPVNAPAAEVLWILLLGLLTIGIVLRLQNLLEATTGDVVKRGHFYVVGYSLLAAAWVTLHFLSVLFILQLKLGKTFKTKRTASVDEVPLVAELTALITRALVARETIPSVTKLHSPSISHAFVDTFCLFSTRLYSL